MCQCDSAPYRYPDLVKDNCGKNVNGRKATGKQSQCINYSASEYKEELGLGYTIGY